MLRQIDHQLDAKAYLKRDLINIVIGLALGTVVALVDYQSLRAYAPVLYLLSLVGLAAVLLVAYLHSYRSSVSGGAQPMTVLVAKNLIPRGTSGALIAQQHLYQVSTVPKANVPASARARAPGT